MRKQLFLLFFILVNMLYQLPVAAQMMVEKEKAVLAINWQNHLKQYDLIWKNLPTDWHEGAYMGNGNIGLLLFKDPDSNALILHIGTTNMNSLELTDKDLFSPGYFRLEPNGKIISGSMRLSLWNAETETKIITSTGTINLTSFVHADEMVMINRTTTTGKEDSFKWTWIPTSNKGKKFSLSTYLAPEGGKCILTAAQKNKTTILWYDQKKSNHRTLYITLNHSYKDTVATELGKNVFRNQLRKGYNRVKAAHRNWWHDFYTASFIAIPDAKLENYYWLQMYKLGTLARPNSPMINISGLWQKEFASKAVWPPRVLLPYWALNGSNHVDLASSLEDIYISENQGTDNMARLRTKRVFLENLFRKNTMDYSYATKKRNSVWETSDLVWICYNIWIHYRYKMDNQTLESLYPILKQTINKYLQNIIKDQEGTYHLPAVFLADYGYVSDYNYDLALLKWGCQTLISISNRLQINDAQVAEWRHILKNLAPISTDKNGILIGRNTPLRTSISSYAHLISIYPLYLINIENQENERLIENSLNTWLKQGNELQGYSYAGASSAFSAIRKGNQALRYLKLLTDYRLTKNTLYCKEENSIVSPIAGTQCILDMLIQSWGGKIRIFPALPDKWKNVKFYHLRTEGAFLVSAERFNGETKFIEITNDLGELCTVEIDFDNPHFETARKIKITRIADHIYNIPIRKGESVRIYPKNTNPSFTVGPIAHKHSNFFGDNN